jgi:hypothetical protein
MAGVMTKDSSYFNAVVRHSRHIYLACAVDELSQQQIAGTVFVSWMNGAFSGSLTSEWNCVGLAMVEEENVQRMVAIGEYGQVLVAGGGKQLNEQIPAASERESLRYAKRIGGHVYAAGMGRYVYKRTGFDNWLDISVQPSAAPSDDTFGFEGIDGFNDREIYAVGWEGEIWLFDGKSWRSEATPTNGILVAACCGGNGVVYAAGRQGLLVRGRRDRWEVLKQDGILDDIWGLCWYDDALYLSTMNSIYRLDGDDPKRINFGRDTPETCFRLVAGDGVMCSVGAKDAMLYDGKKWIRID